MRCNMAKAFSEVNDILLHSEKEIQDKIPQRFYEIIRSNMDLEWKIKIDYSKDINDQEILKETKTILAIIYRDYLCSEIEKNAFVEKNRLALLERHRKEQEMFVKGNNNLKIIYETKLINSDKPIVNVPVVIEDKKWYEKFYEWIRRKIK